ncbi:hypothetical protein J416_11762 [Gracilibacillus halophilus YIM-C55.5]|uniref:Uncharacterized protein n=1 Tax=Gracilibacillus halophilus YIM-C55.5 TaxID=1308866 RepID=N4WSV4_9BACI|nr:hypothetical protein [Gracilibacillus halophilus]ENH96251.1 hypothetical protein J416_11762 [Gracilibacillus halophilus YIM-C55.5]
MVEQTKAAMEGYNYWTGEEISSFHSAAIVVAGLSSHFTSWRRGRSLTYPCQSSTEKSEGKETGE